MRLSINNNKNGEQTQLLTIELCNIMFNRIGSAWKLEQEKLESFIFHIVCWQMVKMFPSGLIIADTISTFVVTRNIEQSS